MVKVTQRLTREDWILAGFRALVAGGAGALRVEPVARALGATKGSFYWHFSDPADWRTAMLVYWKDAAFSRIVSGLNLLPKGEARLQALARIAATGARDQAHGGAAGEPALRDWARYDPGVADALRWVDAERLRFVAECFRDAGLESRAAGHAARLFYAAYIGLQSLGAPAGEDVADLARLIDALTGALTGAGAGSATA